MIEELGKFIDWLIELKSRTHEGFTDKDFYAIGLYGFYLEVRKEENSKGEKEG